MTAAAAALPRAARLRGSRSRAPLHRVSLPLLGSLAAMLAPVRGQLPVPRAGVEKVLAAMDDAFARGDAEGLLATFAPDHPGAQDAFSRRMRDLLAHAPLRAKSAIVGEPRVVGDRTVALVRREVLRDAATMPLISHFYIAFRDAAAEPVPTFAVEIPTVPGNHVANERFTCPPCNYRVGGAPGWLCVPHCSQQSESMETVSFYLLGTDVAVDVSIKIAETPTTAAAMAKKYADALATSVEGARAGAVEPWTPASLAKVPPRFDSARVTVSLPFEDAVVIFHVAALGTLHHLLALRGSAAGIAANRARVDALLATYELTEPDADLALASARALLHHSGELSGDRFVHARRGVEVRGPAGWKGAVHAGGFAFQVVWTSPDGAAVLRCTGYLPPAGLPRWRRAEAERWLADMQWQKGFDAVAEGDWQADDGGSFAVRTFTCTARGGDASKDAGKRRLLRLCLRDDLVVVFSGHAKSEEHVRALHDAMGSLRQRKD